jgi:prepilin-type processing-associated H-X9-DG protein
MAILMPTLNRAKEQGRRAACLSNVRQLVLAWLMYADENGGKIVNGAGGVDRTGEIAWVGRCWANDYTTGGQLPEAQQKTGIKAGALWSYTRDLKLYRCPTGRRGEMLTYAVMDSMNGYTASRAGVLTSTGASVRVGNTVLYIKRQTDIISPSTTYRMVFIDEGWVTPDSYAVYYSQETWWDDAPIRHGDGTNASFADGHAEYWKWNGTDTVKWGKAQDRGHTSNNHKPETEAGFDDLHRLQKATWGRLGYTPSTP